MFIIPKSKVSLANLDNFKTKTNEICNSATLLQGLSTLFLRSFLEDFNYEIPELGYAGHIDPLVGRVGRAEGRTA